MLICQLTDLHVRPAGEPICGIVDSNRLADRAFRAAATFEPRLDAIVITGDLTEYGQEREYLAFRTLLERHVSVPVFVIPGNHDIRETFQRMLGHMPGVCEQGEFVQYVVDAFPVRLIMLDTLVPGSAHGALCERRLAFLERALAEAPERPTIVAMHHPPFECGIDHMDRIALANGDAFESLVAKHPQVERIICGHHHRPVFTRFGGTVASIGPSVAHQVELALAPDQVGAFVMEPPAFHVHRWRPGSGMVTHHAYVDDHPGPYPFVDCPRNPCPG